jgi:hypothetical protein
VKNRTVLPTGALDRLKRIGSDLGVPVVDLETELLAMGVLADAHIPFDGHWSALGHDRIARILTSYIAAHPHLCGTTESEASARD